LVAVVCGVAADAADQEVNAAAAAERVVAIVAVEDVGELVADEYVVVRAAVDVLDVDDGVLDDAADIDVGPGAVLLLPSAASR
jgi:hypothetical protein